MKGFGLLSIIVSVFPVVHMTDVFVYGTLKKGQPNYFRMVDKDHTNGQAEFVAHACTVDRYPLVIATENNFPFLLDAPGTGKHVHGEIYRVDEQMLKFLDEFEDYPKLYQRSLIRLEVQDGPGGGEHTLESGSSVEAFVYIKEKFEPEWLQKPTYESYDAYGDHGLLYHDEDG